jgi:hypothetical protein
MAFMASASSAKLSDRQRAGIERLVGDLRAVFGARLQALVAYGLTPPAAGEGPVRTLGLVERVAFDDLARLVPLVAEWQRLGLAVPLLLSKHEFERSLDVFPLEYGSIIANHVAIVGEHVFGDTRVADADRRRGCEEQAKSHLIHLREGFLETQGDPRNVARLIASSAPAFQTLLANLAQLEASVAVEVETNALASVIERTIGVPAALVVDVLSAPAGLGTVADPTALLERYIDASERIWRYVDGWRV